jgi:hypothetical protein
MLQKQGEMVDRVIQLFWSTTEPTCKPLYSLQVFTGWLRVVYTLAIVLVYTDSHNTMGVNPVQTSVTVLCFLHQLSGNLVIFGEPQVV